MSAGALALRARAEPDFFLFPGRIERHEIHRVGIGDLQQLVHNIAAWRFGCDCHQRVEDRLVARLPPAKPFGQGSENMRGLSEQFARFRNTILLANVLGLIGYVLEPTAPPRMFPSFGFMDALDSMSGLNHGSGLVSLAANPYAAMPSLHAADSLIVGMVLFSVCRHWWSRVLWALWPAWVWFCVMATANHFLLDVLAGIGVALLSIALMPLLEAGARRLRSGVPDAADAVRT